jgi:hypothetical protein
MPNHYAAWRKSRHSEPNGECIEVAHADDVILVREVLSVTFTGYGGARKV